MNKELNWEEPEDCIAKALYLLQLCQQDLNGGNKQLIWARARQAETYCEMLKFHAHNWIPEDE